jgi:hypothetical protein
VATLYIREYSTIACPGPDFNGMQAGLEPGIDQSPLVFGGGVQLSAVFASTTRIVRLHTDSICSILFGIAPVATTANARMAANQTEFFGVQPGANLKVSVIVNV